MTTLARRNGTQLYRSLTAPGSACAPLGWREYVTQGFWSSLGRVWAYSRGEKVQVFQDEGVKEALQGPVLFAMDHSAYTDVPLGAYMRTLVTPSPNLLLIVRRSMFKEPIPTLLNPFTPINFIERPEQGEKLTPEQKEKNKDILASARSHFPTKAVCIAPQGTTKTTGVLQAENMKRGVFSLLDGYRSPDEVPYDIPVIVSHFQFDLLVDTSRGVIGDGSSVALSRLG